MSARGGLEVESGMACEALLMGKWLRARVVRVGRRRPTGTRDPSLF